MSATASITTIKQKGPWLLIGLGVIGLAISLLHAAPTPVAKAPNGNPVANQPSAAKPTAQAIASYTVAPTLPKYIAIPAIGITKTRVLSLGLLASGAIATPDNLYDTGWYNGSSQPGRLGAMFIYGHISTQGPGGIFYNLKQLRTGDEVIVTRGDNKTFMYQVANTKTYPYNNVDMRTVLSPVTAGVPGLTLMTCTGQVMKSDGEYSERLVVFAKQVSSS